MIQCQKNKFYTLIKVEGHSYKGPAIYYFPGITLKNNYTYHIYREEELLDIAELKIILHKYECWFPKTGISLKLCKTCPATENQWKMKRRSVLKSAPPQKEVS